jgi:translation initiation factor 2 subunit 3
MKQSMKKESQEIIKSRINLPDFSLLNIQDLTPLTKDIIINQPTINILILGDKKKGKTTLVHSLSESISSKIRAEKEPERNREREKNFSQKIGYINTKLYKCKKCSEPECYKSFNSEIEEELKCKNCGNVLELLRHISFIDNPELNIKMNMILNGKIISDGALLLVAANEKLIINNNEDNNDINNNNFKENTSLKNIIIIQNKIDIVMKNNSAKEQYSQIKKYAKNKNAQNSLIIPISAQLKFNLDVLTQYLISIPIPKRDLLSHPKYIIFHSFSFSRSLEESTMIHKNGTLYGILLKGILKLGDNFEILPGICIKTNNKEIRHSPIYGKINIIQNEKNLSNYVIPGGIINLGLKVDSELCKNNILEGNVLGYQEKVGNVYYKIGVKCHFLRKLIQIQEKDWGHHLEYVTDIKKGEVLLLNINFISVGGDIISIKGNNYEEINFELRKPVCIEISEKIAISRKIGNIWRLIGWGEIISNGEEDVIIT